MPTLVSYPGVYVEEDHSLSLSIPSGKTAVPAFIGDFLPRSGGNTTVQCTKINNWAEFVEKFHDRGEVVVTLGEVTKKGVVAFSEGITQVVSVLGDTKDRSKKFEEGKKAITAPIINPLKKSLETKNEAIDISSRKTRSPYALRHYFDNGGGACYVISGCGAYELNVIPKIESALLQHGDISLLCFCGEADQSVAKGVFESLAKFAKDQGLFLLKDAESDGGTNENVACYYPVFEVKFRREMVTFEAVSFPNIDKPESLKSYIDPNNEKVEVVDLIIRETIVDLLRPQIEKKLADDPLYLPASAAAAGIICATDRDRGVWKAPANVPVRNVDFFVGIEALFPPPKPEAAPQKKV